jgi:hypothetical protein
MKRPVRRPALPLLLLTLAGSAGCVALQPFHVRHEPTRLAVRVSEADRARAPLAAERFCRERGLVAWPIGARTVEDLPWRHTLVFGCVPPGPRPDAGRG